LDTVIVNGVAIPIEQFDGPSGDELTAAYRRFNANRATAAGRSSYQTNPSRLQGVPRLQKHKGQAWGGVRIK